MREFVTDEIFVPVKYDKKKNEFRALLDSHGKARHYTSPEMVAEHCGQKYDDILVYRLAGFTGKAKNSK